MVHMRKILTRRFSPQHEFPLSITGHFLREATQANTGANQNQQSHIRALCTYGIFTKTFFYSQLWMFSGANSALKSEWDRNCCLGTTGTTKVLSLATFCTKGAMNVDHHNHFKSSSTLYHFLGQISNLKIAFLVFIITDKKKKKKKKFSVTHPKATE